MKKMSLLLTLVFVFGGVSVRASETEDFVPGRLLVKFKAGVKEEKKNSIVNSRGGRRIGEIPGIGVQVIELPENANERAHQVAFKGHQEVEFAELDPWCAPAAAPNDTYYPYQWHLAKIQASQAWDSTTGNSNVVIAILDTGVNGAHPELASKMVPGWNTYDDNADTSDVGFHGTTVAGTAAAISNNGKAVASVAWGCKIMPIRVANPNGWASGSTIAAGLVWAADHGARVANVSYEWMVLDTLDVAARYFYEKSGVVTFAAGNSGLFDARSDCPYILEVSATDRSDVLASWSNTGNGVDLSAPGTGIITIGTTADTASGTGTSYSAPIVAGVAALVISAKPDLSATEVQDILKQSADDLGSAGWDSSYGWGRVNAARAVSLALGGAGDDDPTPPADTTAPTVSFVSPQAGATVAATVNVKANASDNVGVVSVSFKVDGTTAVTDTTAPYEFAWNTTQVADGAHVLTATAADAAGNTKNATVNVTVTNVVPDTTAPTVSISSPANGATVNGTVTVQVSASDNTGVASVSLKVDGTALGTDTTAPYSFVWNTTQVADGAHVLTATAADAAGNTKNATVNVTVTNVVPDTTAPTVSISSPANGATVNGTVTVQVSASDNTGVASVSLKVDGTALGTDTSAPYSFVWNTTQVANGAHALTATAADAAGNTKNATVNVTVTNVVPDTTAPTVSISSPANGATVNGTVTVQVSASDNTGVASVKLSVDGTALATDTTAPYSFVWNTTQVADGAHVLTATAADAAGNTKNATVNLTVTNVVPDTTAPTVSITSPANGARVNGMVTVRVSASDDVELDSVTLYVDGFEEANKISAPYDFSWDTTTVSDGLHTLTAVAMDTAGNVAETSVDVEVTNAPAEDTVAPTVWITGPSDGSSVRNNVMVKVTASDNVGVIRVELYVDGELTDTSTSDPFTTRWNARDAAKGAHTLQVVACDAAGNVGSSPVITVYK